MMVWLAEIIHTLESYINMWREKWFDLAHHILSKATKGGRAEGSLESYRLIFLKYIRGNQIGLCSTKFKGKHNRQRRLSREIMKIALEGWRNSRLRYPAHVLVRVQYKPMQRDEWGHIPRFIKFALYKNTFNQEKRGIILRFSGNKYCRFSEAQYRRG